MGENFVYGDGTQEFDNDYVAHMSHAAEADHRTSSTRTCGSDQGEWTYDDGETSHERTWTHVGSNYFDGVRGVAGTGYHANLNQRDQTAGEDAGDACSSFIGRSTCVGAADGSRCRATRARASASTTSRPARATAVNSAAEVDVDAVVVFVPIVSGTSP